MRESELSRSVEAVRLVVLGQVCFVATMLVCCSISPSWVAVRLGLSYYGNDLRTVFPYALGFVLCVALTGAGLKRLRPPSARGRRLQQALAGVLALMLLIPLTPYRLDAVLEWLHLGIATALFA